MGFVIGPMPVKFINFPDPLKMDSWSQQETTAATTAFESAITTPAVITKPLGCSSC